MLRKIERSLLPHKEKNGGDKGKKEEENKKRW
jgi:hypothetical protein